MTPIQHALFQTIQHVLMAVKRLYSKLLEPYGITYAQYQVLKTIADHEGLTAKDLLVYMDSDKATLSGILKRLEINNMIKRNTDDVDRRKQRIHCLVEAISLIEQFKKQSEKVEKELLKGLRGRELRLCREVLRQIEGQIIKKNEESMQLP